MRLPRRRPSWLGTRVVDGVIALAMLVELELEARFDTVIPESHRLPAAILVVFLVAPLLVRSRWPGAALLACAAIAGVSQAPWSANVLDGMTGTIFPVILLAFTAGEQLKRSRGFAAVTVAAALIAGGAIWSTAGPATGYSVGSELFAATALPFIFWGLGSIWQQRRRRASAFRDLVESLEQEREYHEQDAAAQERLRISSELQDIIAQNVSAIIVQAGGARQLIGADTEQAANAILSVERAGREALADLRRTLGLLRSDDDPRALAPRPGLAQLGTLLESARKRGLDCTVRTEGDPGDLPTGIDLVGYRVVEAGLLASDQQHSPTGVTIAYGTSRLGIEIRSRGPADGVQDKFRGISERVALYNGTVTVRPMNADGYRVDVQLPREVSSQ